MDEARTRMRRALLVIAAVTALAGVARFYDLGRPDEKVFDEVYYASDGCRYAGHHWESCGLDSDAERSWVHPPLGKVAIGWGISAFGNEPFGWRFSAAIAGTLTVALGGLLALALTSSVLWAGLGALLVATEHLLFVQSRTAMLDVFLAFFVLLGITLIAWDRRRGEAEPVRDEPPETPVVEEEPGRLAWLDEPPEGQGWPDDPPEVDHGRGDRAVPVPLVLAGAAFGAAAAVKWSGVLALLAGAALAVAGARARARRRRGPLRAALARGWPGLVLAFVLVPVFVYLVAWTPWFLRQSEPSVGSWIAHHRAMADYHLGLSTENEEGDPVHPYMSRAGTWLLLQRPVAYFFESERWGEPDATAREILGIGNPVLFWGGLAVIPYLLLAWIFRRDWRYGVVALPILFQYLPWLAVTRPLFLFYMTPVTPFLAIGMAIALRDLAAVRIRRRRALAPVAGLVAAAGVGAFVFFWPVLTARAISDAAWQARMWLPGWV